MRILQITSPICYFESTIARISSKEISSKLSLTREAPHCFIISRLFVVVSPITVMQPASPASTPLTESSKTTHRFGGTLINPAAFKNTSGSGLPLETSPAATILWKRPQFQPDITASMFSLGVEEPTANGNPSLIKNSTNLRTPGSGSIPVSRIISR